MRSSGATGAGEGGDIAVTKRLADRLRRAGPVKGRAKASARDNPAQAGKAAAGSLDAEQVREARESAQAKNAEASTRDRMVDIGRGNQQAGRQRAK